VWAKVGSSTLIGWNRLSRAASFSRCLRYSSSVVAPMVLELAPREHRLEDRGGIDGTLCRTGTNQGVELVDEQDDVSRVLISSGPS